MTVSSEEVRISYVANGSQETFTFDFPVHSTDHLYVYFDGLRQLTGFQTILNPGNTGGSVGFFDPPAADTVVLLRRVSAKKQELELKNNRHIPTADLEQALDLLTLIVQELGEAGISWEQAWSEDTDYSVGDIVIHNEVVYIANAPNLNSEPPSDDWTEFPLPVNFTWRGNWEAATAYEVGDAVSYGGSSYIAVLDSTGQAPPGAAWNLLASKGDQGIQGIQGIQGNPGLDGLPGDALVQISVTNADSPVTCLRNRTYIVDTSGGDVTLNLPTIHAPSNLNRFKHKVGGNEMIIQGNGATIDGAASITSETQGDFLRVEDDGTNWMIT